MKFTNQAGYVIRVMRIRDQTIITTLFMYQWLK
jgi:hypothetical protein